MSLPGGYLVQYGRSAFVGRFAANGVAAGRGESVVVETVRGLEVGLVLAAVPPPTPPDGVTIRAATPADSTDASAILARAEVLAAESPVTFVDAESLIDGICLLHVLPWGDADLSPVCDRLTAEFGRPVRVFDVSRQETTVDPPTGCGKPDCGDGGGCGTGGSCGTGGGCSRKAVKSADELTAFFSDLRRQMDDRRTPLH